MQLLTASGSSYKMVLLVIYLGEKKATVIFLPQSLF